MAARGRASRRLTRAFWPSGSGAPPLPAAVVRRRHRSERRGLGERAAKDKESPRRDQGIVLSCAGEYTALPNRLAGTARQYSTKASAQLMRMTRNNGTSLNRRCQYHAVVMKMLDPTNNSIGSRYAEKD